MAMEIYIIKSDIKKLTGHVTHYWEPKPVKLKVWNLSFCSAEQKEDKKHVEMEESGEQMVLIGNLKKIKSWFIVLSEALTGITLDTLPFDILWSKF